MKYILSFLSLTVIFGSMVVSMVPVFAGLENDLYVTDGANSAESDTNVSIQNNFLKTIQVYLLGSYAIIAIGSFIFIGFKLFTAKGDPSEFKKAWIAFLYVAIGLVIAPLAYVIVRIVSGYSF